MIHTYSVIIQNKKTIDAFSQYRLLFAESLDKEQIGICEWHEEGKNIDEALPGLSKLTNDKKEWRAIIVRYVDDDCMSKFQSDNKNPFDFLDVTKNDLLDENPVPIIRLTNMLGGFQPLDIEFEPVIEIEDYKKPKRVYFPVEQDEKKEALHKELVEKYQYDGKLPDSIILISVRYKLSESLSDLWGVHNEANSSEFWKRNGYPNSCKYLVYDFAKEGPVQKSADEFGFWYTILILALNDWDSGTIQSNWVYKIYANMNEGLMMDSFQSFADRLRIKKDEIEKNIKKETRNFELSRDLPDYKMNVPVVITKNKIQNSEIDKKIFGLFSENNVKDLMEWEGQCKKIENDYKDSIQSINIELDRTASLLRGNCSYSEQEVNLMNDYQTEDLINETSEIYREIVELQNRLPDINFGDNEEILKNDQEIKENLAQRMRARPAILVIVTISILMVLAGLPALASKVSNLFSMIGLVILSTLAVGLSGAGVIYYQKRKLDDLINDYNRNLNESFNKITEQSVDYSKYLSNIASHIHGKSYLSIANNKKKHSNTRYYSKYDNIKTINQLLDMLKIWSIAYHLNIDYSSNLSDIKTDKRNVKLPLNIGLYSFDNGMMYPVYINNSGMIVYSPFSFSDKIEITREELFDDERN